jgi:hypothetical protein
VSGFLSYFGIHTFAFILSICHSMGQGRGRGILATVQHIECFWNKLNASGTNEPQRSPAPLLVLDDYLPGAAVVLEWPYLRTSGFGLNARPLDVVMLRYFPYKIRSGVNFRTETLAFGKISGPSASSSLNRGGGPRC